VYKNTTPVIYWANGVLVKDKKGQYHEILNLVWKDLLADANLSKKQLKI